MKVIDDGVIKYDRTNFSQSPPLLEIEYKELEYWRKKLYNLNLIGEYQESKIGFGNASAIYDYSKRHQSSVPQFIITGTQTGKYADLDGSHYTRILDYFIDELKVSMEGPVEASSEVLTHAAIYQKNPLIKVVFHAHSNIIWKMMIDKKYPYTAEKITYGTVEMAKATQECVGELTSGSICLHGHADGFISYGTSLEEAWNNIFDLYTQAYICA